MRSWTPIRLISLIRDACGRLSAGKYSSVKPFSLATSAILIMPGMGRRWPSRDNSPTKILA